MSQRNPHGILIRGRLAALAIAFLFLSSPLLPQEVVVNTIKSIKTTADGVEIELTSSKAFPVRNEVAILKVGIAEFTTSRAPEDGSLNTLIFTLTASQFASLEPAGEDVSLQYGRSEAEFQWHFGNLDKSLLDRR